MSVFLCSHTDTHRHTQTHTHTHTHTHIYIYIYIYEIEIAPKLIFFQGHLFLLGSELIANVSTA